MVRCLALTLLFAGPAVASPIHIPWSGHVFDADGNPVTGPADVTVTLRADSDPTSPLLWTDTFTQVPMEHGYIQLMLGTDIPLDLSDFPVEPSYISVAVDNAVVMGLTQLSAVPYAVRAHALSISDDATCDADHAGRVGSIPGGGVRLCSGADGWLILETTP